MNRIVAAIALLAATSGTAFATVNRVPEPGVLELALVAAVVGYLAHKRRK